MDKLSKILVITCIFLSFSAFSESANNELWNEYIKKCSPSKRNENVVIAGEKGAGVKFDCKNFVLYADSTNFLWKQETKFGFNVKFVKENDRYYEQDLNGWVCELKSEERDFYYSFDTLLKMAYFILIGQDSKPEYLGEKTFTRYGNKKTCGIFSIPVSDEESAEIWIDASTKLPYKYKFRYAEIIVRNREINGKFVPKEIWIFNPYAQRGNASQGPVYFEASEIQFDQNFSKSELKKPDYKIDYKFPENAKSAELECEFVNDMILVKVGINGSENVFFLLDSGAELTTVDSDFVKKYAEFVSAGMVQGVAGQESGGLGKIKSIKFGSVELNEQYAGSMPLKMFEQTLGKDVKGLLGYDFFSRFAVEIDYLNNKLIIHDPFSYEPEDVDEIVELSVIEKRPVIKASINDSEKTAEGNFIVDTGAQSLFSCSNTLVENIKPEQGFSTEYAMAGGGGRISANLSAYKSVILGSMELQFPIAVVSSTPRFTQGVVNGLIGQRFINCFNIVFDYYNSKMYLKKTKYSDFFSVKSLAFFGNVLRRQKKYEQALTALEKASEINENYADLHLEFAYLYNLTRKTEQALNSIEKTLLLDPSLKQKISSDNSFRNLRNNQRFKDLIK